MALDGESRELVAPYVSSSSSRVFALRGLPEEAVAALFAKASRSPDGLRATLASMLATEALDQDGFLRAWASSPRASAHEAIHVGFEGLSLLAASALADTRAGAVFERELAHVSLDPATITTPDAPPELQAVARSSSERLLATYASLLPRVTEAIATRLAGQIDAKPAAHALLRGLLPAGAQTEIGLTASASTARRMIAKLLSSPLSEVQRLGASLRDAARSVAPSALEGVDASPLLQSQRASVADVLRTIYTLPADGASATVVVNQPARVIRYDRDALARVALALAYEGSDPRAHASAFLDGFSHASSRELEDLVRASVARRDTGEPLPRGFEASSITFELMTDLATYRELGHQRVSPALQLITCRLGFETPGALGDLGFYDAYGDAMMSAYDAWLKLQRHDAVQAQYLVPIGYRVRALWTLDLRALGELLEELTSARAPAGVRRVGQALYRAAVGAHPWLAGIGRVDLDPVSTIG